MNDVSETAKSAKKNQLFTDDTNIFSVNKKTIKLKQDAKINLLELSEWFAANKFTFNNN